jgi:hypothetical protein
MPKLPIPKFGSTVPAIVVCTLAAAAFLFAAALFLQGGFNAALAQETEQKTLTPVDPAIEQALAEQQARLNEGVRWIDEEQGVVGLPIDAAMDALVKRSEAETSQP